MKQTKVLIIGGGPAGMACALQLHRFQIDILLCEEDVFGGLLLNANLIENYLGFPTGISGRELASLFSSQIKKHHVPALKTRIQELSFQNTMFTAVTDAGEIQAEQCVIASGTQPIQCTDVFIEEKDKHILQYDLKKIIHSTKKKHIIVIGSGDAAFDYALNLSKHHQITLINRSNKIKCLPLLFQRVQESDTITYLQNLLLVKVGLIENQPLAIFKDTQTQQMIPFSMDYIVVAIGRTPRLDFLHQSLIERKDFLQDTNKLYFIGDVHHGRNRQCSIAIGDGIETAMKIYLLQDENR